MPRLSAEHQQAYDSGDVAEARCAGALRGGFILGATFYTHVATSPLCFPVDALSDVRVLIPAAGRVDDERLAGGHIAGGNR